MTLDHRRRFVYGQLGLMLVAAATLSILGVLSVETFFLVSFVGLLMLLELTSPAHVRPRWQLRLRWILLAGLLGFGYVVFTHVQRAFSGGLS
ncbi:hypothetical protein ZOD2009_14286 [Haladaptatus paucihalophilus DX253]|uniref:Uncharacterized protein n=1 Tax=Haladaptatus paucihalophilus DX253 TaxID=797209 RepID=E7QVM1_HALPU|nr:MULTISPECIES: hypothetical protein [Haladaptatus]EFW91284.1 hypothetical protein ZOD2009_14286 [Haladaptatus paucihalophilus DX253]GKZ14674.1 hypothetical protein HAL_25550 [Haladaptatus sp. T7]SHL09656.1 hypothetical protein SAMN05444342_3010 [Haladaptatus paucihalophilus DX253]